MGKPGVHPESWSRIKASGHHRHVGRHKAQGKEVGKDDMGASGLGHRLRWDAPPEMRPDSNYSGIAVRAETSEP